MAFSSSWLSSTNSLSLELKLNTDHNDLGHQPRSEETPTIRISKRKKTELKIRKKTTGNNDSRRKTTAVIAIEQLLISGLIWGRLLTSKS